MIPRRGKRVIHLKKKIHLYLIFLIIISIIFIVAGSYLYIIKDIPSVKVLKNLESKPISSVYDINGQLAYVLIPDNRIFVNYDRIPKYVRDAFLAAEDADFFKHGAIDIMSIVRALWKNIVSGRVVQGGSTISQQVIKALMLGPEKSIMRKIREAILAYRLEHYLSKKEILNLYLNNIYMGHGVYGVEAASQVYFGKHIWEITRAEAALLAGIVQAPSRYTPKRHPGSARLRQEYVIEQMFEKGFIDEKRKKMMLKENVFVKESNGIFTDTYFKDYIVRYIDEKYGKGILLNKELKIYATLDAQLQRLAEESIKRGLNIYEERAGNYLVQYRLEKRKWDDFIKIEGRDITLKGLKKDGIYNLLISERIKDGYAVFAGKERGILKITTFPYRPGDVVRGIYRGKDKKQGHLFQAVKSSRVEGALICVDANTGYVYAMVGGRDFERSPYNRALYAKIQSGSAFKPFVYLAALKKGYDLDSTLIDEPKEYHVGMGKTWIPKNYDDRYEGSITLRDAIAYSKNAATVRLLEDVGVSAVKENMEALGINAEIENNLSIALGTSNLTLLDLVKGFSVFANGGNRVKPLFIKSIMDKEGNVMEENSTEKQRVIPEEIAFKMNVLLKGVVEYGTAKGATRLGYPVAGKTGTTSNFYDALFIGYSPYITTGVWVGFDSRTSLGKGESGARVCLPIWMNFMATALRRFPPDDFPQITTEPWPRLY